MVWDWGFNWQGVRLESVVPLYSGSLADLTKIQINGGTIGFNISGKGGDSSQGTGSTSIIGMPPNVKMLL